MNTNSDFEPIKTKRRAMKELRERQKQSQEREALRRRIERKALRRNEVTSVVRREVYERFGSRCYLCGDEGADTIDHVVPLIKGGSNDIKNLRPAHALCNKEKGAKIVILPEELEAIGW